MFINQVTFEMDLENEAMLQNIMKTKAESVRLAPGNASAEVWRTTKSEAVGYTLVTKWDSKESFKQWMIESHKNHPHKKPSPGETRPRLEKTAIQHELLDI